MGQGERCAKDTSYEVTVNHACRAKMGLNSPLGAAIGETLAGCIKDQASKAVCGCRLELEYSRIILYI